jgi:hypothetical protein
MFYKKRFTKLASLLVKTLAKPLSKRIKHEFSRYDFSKQVLIGIGQTSHKVTSRMQIWSAGYRVRSIKPLKPDAALKDGSEFVGESFIFMVSGGLVVFEYNRSQESAKGKEAAKREKQKQENAALNAKLHALDVRLKAVEKVVDRNAVSILSLVGPKYVKPPSEELVPIDDEEEEEEKSTSDNPSKTVEATTPEPEQSKSTKPWWKIW